MNVLISLFTALILAGCATAQTAGPPPNTFHVNKMGYDQYVPQCLGITLPHQLIVVYREAQYLVAYDKSGCVARVGGDELRGHASTGKLGFETPVGNPQQGPSVSYRGKRDHRSSEWDAPMPTPIFFTVGGEPRGHAIHAREGIYRSPKEPVYGAPYGRSHGCVGVEKRLAAVLYDHFWDHETRVIVVSDPAVLKVLWVEGYYRRKAV